MKDFLNCYEKLDVDYTKLKTFYNKINLINRNDQFLKRKARTKTELYYLRKKLDDTLEYFDKLYKSIDSPYSVSRDNTIRVLVNKLGTLLYAFREFCDLTYDTDRKDVLKPLADKMLELIKEICMRIDEAYTENRDDKIVFLLDEITDHVSNLYIILEQPYIDEIWKGLIDNALKEAENTKFPIKSNIALKKNAILQNAYNIEETQELNGIYHINFAIPGDDNKLDCIQPNGFIRYNEDGQLYRITKKGMNHDDTDIMTVEAEHVITTLCNDIMYGSYTYGGDSVGTAKVINYILGFQKTKNWVLAGCDFDRRFEYTWKYETLLSALLSIPKEFGEDYMWDYDTTGYPWKLYLRRLNKDSIPKFYIRAKRNLISAEHSSDYTGIVTRVYAFGYEDENGVQLDISAVNGGVPYVEAKPEIIEKYGLISTVLIDRRFENAESLKAYAEAYLHNAIEPGVSRTFDVVDLYPITNSDIDNARVGELTRLVGDGTNVFITKTTRVHDQPGNLNLELSTKSTTLVDQIADIANRVQIDSVYS